MKRIKKILYYSGLLLMLPIKLIIGSIMYSKTYFPKGLWFSSFKSEGWRWVFPDFFARLFFGKNRGVPWPCSPYVNVGNSNIVFDPDDLDNFQSQGTYYQTWDAKIYIGYGTYIAQGVGLITSNHDIANLDMRGKIEDIVIGERCWIGMNSVILPGIHLAKGTIVGAGSIVTKSVLEENCVVAGNPAKIVKRYNSTKEVIDGF